MTSHRKETKMILSIVGKKSTQTILEFGGLQYDHTDETVRAKYIDALSINHETEKSDISLYIVDDSEKIQRMKNGDSCSPVWENGEITGLDFSAEDSKKKIEISVDDATVLIGEAITLSLTVYDADGETVITNESGTIRVPMSSPDGSLNVRIDYSNGVGTKQIVMSKAGSYKIGALHIEDMRMINEPLNIEVDI